jgi:RimJ/RimL family protein N-acetyltransferase
VLRVLAPPRARLLTCGVRRGDRLVASLVGWEQGPPFWRRLTFPSLPAFAERTDEVAACMWAGLKGLARRRRAPWVELSGLYGAACAVPGSLGSVRSLRWRHELVMDLPAPGRGAGDSQPAAWRDRISAGDRAGLSLEVARHDEALAAHLAFMARGFDASAPAEPHPPPLRPEVQARLVRAGAAFVAQAIGPGGVQASALVLDTRPMACVLGVAAEASEPGLSAAALLVWRVGEQLAAAGARQVHLGGVTEEAPLPALRLRQAFATSQRHAMHLVMAAGPRWPAHLSAAWRTGTGSPARLVRALADRVARLERFVVHAWGPGDWRAPEVPAGVTLRRLSDEELVTASVHSDALGTHRRYLQQHGFNGAWGIFVDGELAHVSWVLTRADHERLPLAHLRLAADEAELGNCVTLPRFRGRGLYPLAVRAISGRLFGSGVRRVYLVTARGNAASARGIEKAGPAPCGRVSILWLRALRRARIRRDVPGMAAPVEWVNGLRR